MYVDDLGALRAHSAIVLREPRFFFADAGQLSLAHLGTSSIPAGALLRLWQDDAFHRGCPDCGGRILIHSIVGSPLSGTHSWQGFCVGCRGAFRGCPPEETRPFAELWRPAHTLVLETRSKLVPTIEPTIPLSALADVLRGGRGATELELIATGECFVFDWATETLRDASGRALLQASAVDVRYVGGAPGWAWDQRSLVADGVAVATVVRGRARPKVLMQLGTRSALPGHPEDAEIWIGAPKKPVRHYLANDGLYDAEGTHVLGWRTRPRLAVAILTLTHGGRLGEIARATTRDPMCS